MSEQDDIAPGGIDAGNQLRAAPAGRRQNDGSRGSGFVGRFILTSTIDLNCLIRHRFPCERFLQSPNASFFIESGDDDGNQSGGPL